MHLADPIFIFILALVLLGPKRTGELAHQLGKLMAEFRKASNDFKYQFNEEMRVAEQQEKQRKQEAERADAANSVSALPPPVTENSILSTVQTAPDTASTNDLHEFPSSEAVPYAVSAVSATSGEEHPVDDHPLLRVDVIPPMDGAPADQTAATAVTGRESDHG